jgi:hypothetical protein
MVSFQKRVFNFTYFYDYLVVADIANYYDYIKIAQIKSIYQSFGGLDEVILDLIFYILEKYSWRPDYIPGTNRGLPQMNFDAHGFLPIPSFLSLIDLLPQTIEAHTHASWTILMWVSLP